MITREQQYYDPPVNALAAMGRGVIGAPGPLGAGASVPLCNIVFRG